jgi:hypothetical protein
LARLLVLRGAQEDSAEMAEKVGAYDPELVLRQIPRELRERRREDQRRDRDCFGVHPPLLHAACDEVVGITTTP